MDSRRQSIRCVLRFDEFKEFGEFDEFVEDFKGFREADFRTEGADHRFLLMKLARGAQTEFF